MKNETLKFKEDEYQHFLFDITTYTIVFAQYREDYIKLIEEELKQALCEYKLDLKVDYESSTLTVKTTKLTKDPVIVLKGRDVITLLARGMELRRALKVLKDKYVSEVISIAKLVSSKEVMINRRKRFEGSGEMTIKALMMLTKTKITMQGKTIAILGTFQGIKEVKDVIADVFEKNIHPVYSIKKLIAKRKLEGDKEYSTKDWSKYLPEYKSKSSNKRGDGKKKKASNKEKIDEVL